uniref:Uncharacterized protein n=1 Tax=Geladintestivirus 2 TaxID=3233134 RepID=A0AAU8MGQ8_9CAUD
MDDLTELNDYSVVIDSDTLNQDFDVIDLYGDKQVNESEDNFGENIEFN